MTIPLQMPQIHPGFVETAPPNQGLGMLLQAIQHRQRINLDKENLRREWEQFELNKKMAGPQLDSILLENEKKKRDLQDREEDLSARSEAQRLYAGGLLSHPDDDKAWGDVIAGVKDPRVATWLMTYIREGMQIQPTYTIQKSPGQNGNEYVGIDQRNPKRTVRTGVRAPADTEPTRRIPVITEREKASAAIGAAQANSIINQLETADPTIAQRVARKVANTRTVLGAAAKRLLGTPEDDIAFQQEAQIEQALTPQELQYYQAQKLFLGSVLPGLSGKTVTAREFMMQAPPYFSMGGGSPGVTTSRRKARATRIRGFITESGEAMTERLGEIQDPSEYGIRAQPGVTVTPTNKPRQRRPENPY